MFVPQEARRELAQVLDAIEERQLVVLPLDELRHLLSEPEADPFRDRRSPDEPGVDHLAATLAALRRLPEALTVRVVLPAGAIPEVSATDAEDALHGAARRRAGASWREAMAIRAMGLRQLPFGIVISVVAAVLAYTFGYLAQEADAAGVTALLLVLAGLALTIAWVLSWMVLESAYLDWRPASRKAAAYELLTRARLEVVQEGGAPQ